MTDNDIHAYVRENRESLIRVIRHSSNTYARACVWALLDAGLDDPEIEDLEDELQAIKEDRKRRRDD